jgi:hypothetical protein
VQVLAIPATKKTEMIAKLEPGAWVRPHPHVASSGAPIAVVRGSSQWQCMWGAKQLLLCCCCCCCCTLLPWLLRACMQGQMSWKERLAYLDPEHKLVVGDLNHDGRVDTPPELGDANDDGKVNAIDAFDMDGDGMLGEEELQELREVLEMLEVRSHRGAHHHEGDVCHELHH